MTSPLAVAITGGIGAGKSETLRAFARHGAATVSSDEIVHHLLRRDEVRRAVVARMGHGIVSPDDGEIDRGALATVVFNDPDALAWLEELLHPLVAAEYLAWREALAALESPPRVCVTEVPLLYEVGGESRFDKVVAITAPRQLRRSRSSVALDERESRLLPDREKAARADFAYVNTGTVEELDEFVASVMHTLTA